MADRIALTGLRVRGNHGVFEHEKRDGQEFVVDITLWLDLSSASRSDERRRPRGGRHARHRETVAGRIADAAMTDTRLHAVEVTVHKPSAPIPLTFDDVSVTIRRSRRLAAPLKEAK